MFHFSLDILRKKVVVIIFAYEVRGIIIVLLTLFFTPHPLPFCLLCFVVKIVFLSASHSIRNLGVPVISRLCRIVTPLLIWMENAKEDGDLRLTVSDFKMHEKKKMLLFGLGWSISGSNSACSVASSPLKWLDAEKGRGSGESTSSHCIEVRCPVVLI